MLFWQWQAFFWRSSAKMSSLHPRCHRRDTIASKQVKCSCDNLFPHRTAHMCTVFTEACTVILFYLTIKVCSWMQCRLRCMNNGFIVDFSLSNTSILYPYTHIVTEKQSNSWSTIVVTSLWRATQDVTKEKLLCVFPGSALINQRHQTRGICHQRKWAVTLYKACTLFKAFDMA